MKFFDYQNQAREFAAYHPTVALQYLTAALAEETGEALGVIAKNVRKHGTYTLTDAAYQELYDELGDVLWNLTMIADTYGMRMGGIAQGNIDKLTDRKESNTIVSRSEPSV